MSNSNQSGGIGVLSLLGVVFVVLKLTDVIDWSWWYVTMPFWGGLAALAIVGVVAFAVYLILALLNGSGTRKFNKRLTATEKALDEVKRKSNQ